MHIICRFLDVQRAPGYHTEVEQDSRALKQKNGAMRNGGGQTATVSGKRNRKNDELIALRGKHAPSCALP